MFGFIFKEYNNIEVPQTFLKKIKYLRAKNIPTPLTEEYEKELQQRKLHPLKTWYKTQGEHWEGWLSEYNGGGFYNRKNHKRSSEFIYNHIMCQPMLIWLAETVDIERQIIEKAIEESLKVNTFQEQCRIIRKNIPWSNIKNKLTTLPL